MAHHLIARDALGALTKLGQGGQGIIYHAPKVKAKFANAMVFKEYKPQARVDVSFEALAAMPNLVEDTLSYDDGEGLVSIAAWPCAIVENGTGPVGFVMPAIPAPFEIDFTTVKGHSRATAEFQHLLNPPSVLMARGITISDKQRYQLLREVAKALAFLHRIGVCMGDISPKNVLFSLNPRPAVFFLDCDAMRINGVSALPQLETPEWEVPTGEELATTYSDTYKLSLLALRLLAGDQHTRNPQDLPSTTPKPLRQLVTDTLTKEPDQRPAPEAWTYLVGHVIDEAQQNTTGPLVTSPAPAPTPRTYTPEPAPVVLSRPSSGSTQAASLSPSATSWLLTSQQKIYGGVAIVLLFIIVIIIAVANQASNTTTTSRSSSSSSTYRSSPTATTTTTPPTPEELTARNIRSASVGDCIHRTAATQQNPDGSYNVTVDSAACGTGYSTDRVILRTNNVNNCGPNDGWVRTYNPSPAVLCLEPN